MLDLVGEKSGPQLEFEERSRSSFSKLAIGNARSESGGRRSQNGGNSATGYTEISDDWQWNLHGNSRVTYKYRDLVEDGSERLSSTRLGFPISRQQIFYLLLH